MGPPRLRSIESLPTEIYDIITYYFACHSAPWGCQGPELKLSYEQLKLLRQVNRSFHSSASRLLFRKVNGKVDRPKGKSLEYLKALCDSEVRHYIQLLSLGSTHDLSSSMADYIHGICQLLPHLLKQLSSLRYLMLEFPSCGPNPAIPGLPGEEIQKIFAVLNEHKHPNLRIYWQGYFNKPEGPHGPQNSSSSPSLASIMAALAGFSFAYSGQGSLVKSELSTTLAFGRNLTTISLANLKYLKDMPGELFSVLHPDTPLRAVHLQRITISCGEMLALCRFSKSLKFLAVQYVGLIEGKWSDFHAAVNQSSALKTVVFYSRLPRDVDDMGPKVDLAAFYVAKEPDRASRGGPTCKCCRKAYPIISYYWPGWEPPSRCLTY